MLKVYHENENDSVHTLTYIPILHMYYNVGTEYLYYFPFVQHDTNPMNRDYGLLFPSIVHYRLSPPKSLKQYL